MAKKINLGKVVVGVPSYKTIQDLIEASRDKKHSLSLTVGKVIELEGYYTAGDGAGHKRKIESEDDGSGVQLGNGLWANRVIETSHFLMYETLLKQTKGFIGHRGLSQIAPENTLPAYQKAYDNNIFIWECDIDLTADNVWVLMHDSTVDRTTNGTGNINRLTLNEVKKLEIDGGANATTYFSGTKVPTFEEWLQLAKKLNCIPFAELKRLNASEEEVKSIIDIIKKYNMEERFAFCSFGHEVLEKVRKFTNKIQLWWIPNDINQEAINWCKKIGNAHLYPYYSVATKNKIELANSQGVNIAVWTVDDPKIAQELFDKGVMLIATNCLSEVY